MRGLLDFIAVLLLAICLSHCGDGRVTIQTTIEKKHKIQPEPILLELHQAQSSKLATEKTLNRLFEPSLFQFDWTEFWSQLSSKSWASKLYSDHQEQLHKLSLASCDDYPSFIRFVIAVKGDVRSSLSTDRKCYPKLSVKLVEEMVQLVYSDIRYQSEELLTLLFPWIEEEITRTQFYSDWNSFIESTKVQLETLGKVLVEHHLAEHYFKWIHFVWGNFGTAGVSPSLVSLITYNESSMAKWFASEEILHSSYFRITQLLKLNRGVLGLGKTPLALLQTGIVERVRSTVQANDWLRYYELRLLLSQLQNQNRSIAERIADYESLAELILETVVNLPQLESETVYASLQRRSLSDSEFSGLEHFVVQHLSALNPVRFERRDNIHPESAIEVSQVGSIDDAFKLLSVAKRTSDKFIVEKLLQRLCDYFVSQGVASRELFEKDLLEMLDSKLPFGCYSFSVAEEESDLVIHKTKPMDMSPLSVLYFENQHLEFKAPSLRMGSIVIHNTFQYDPAVTTPTSPNRDAIVFPLILGIETQAIEMKKQESKRRQDLLKVEAGTHYFTFHFTARKAQDGEGEVLPPLDGKPGYNLTLKTEKPVQPFVFVSFGGVGQQGASPRAGGKGDVSILDIKALEQTLEDKHSLGQIKNVKQLIPERELSLWRLKLLMDHSVENKNGKIPITLIPESIFRLPEPQKEKIVDFCREVLRAENKLTPQFNEADWELCFNKAILSPAWAFLQRELRNANFNNEIERYNPPLYLNPEIPWREPPGAIGPLNESGKMGKNGKLFLKTYP